MKYPAFPVPLVIGVIAGALSVALPNAAAGQIGASSSGDKKAENAMAEILRDQADRSEKALQAAVAAVHELSGVLQAEASQSTAATRRDSEAIQHTMDLFLWIVAVVSAVLVAGASLLAWALAAWGKASKADIQQEVRAQTNLRVTESIAADKPRYDAMLDNHLQKTKSDLTKLMNTQVKDAVDQFKARLQEITASLENIAEAVENLREDPDSQELPLEPSKSEPEAMASAIRQTISDRELAILHALWAKPGSRRTVYNISRDSSCPLEDTLQILANLMQMGLVETLPIRLTHTATKSGATNSRRPDFSVYPWCVYVTTG